MRNRVGPSHENTNNHADRLESFCRREGIPVTVQRRVIFGALLERDDHPTVDQVFARVKDRLPGVSRTTVYRTLETLANWGLIRRTNHFAASARFDGNMEQHDHLVCTICGKVVDFLNARSKIPDLPEVRQNGFTLFDYSVYFEGHCSDCKGSATPLVKTRHRAVLGRPPPGKRKQKGT